MSTLTIFDDHLHLDPNGKRYLAIKEFERSGGTHVLIVHKPYYYPKKEHCDDPATYYQNIFKVTLNLVHECQEKTKVHCYMAVGPYPVEFLKWLELFHNDYDMAFEAFYHGISIATEYISQGNAVAFGEVGRPHFPVAPEVMEYCNRSLKIIMERARVLDTAVIIHSESMRDNPNVWKEIATIADNAGLRRSRVVKHFSPPVVSTEINMGVFPSILCKTEFVNKAILQGRRFMLETDYIDDPNRPGAVLGPRTVPRVTLQLYDKGVLTLDDIETVHIQNPQMVYNIEIEP